MSDGEKNVEPCALCGGTKRLSQVGIFKVYLLPMPGLMGAFLIAVGLVGAVVYSRYFLVFCGLGAVIPLANADLRLYLYPIVAIAGLAGAKINCPKCGGSFIFSRDK